MKLINKKLYGVGVFVLSLILTEFLVSFTSLFKVLLDPFNALFISIFSFIFILLAINEVTILENGYEKRYRFTLSILLISLLSQGIEVTILSTAIGMIIYLLIDYFRKKSINFIELLYEFCSVYLPCLFMSKTFVYIGGEASIVNFPTNFIALILASIMNYIVYTLIILGKSEFNKKVTKTPFHKILYREYGWIIKYDLWQALYAVLFYNSAVVFLYNHWVKFQTGSSAIESADYIYFLSWLVITSSLIYFPIKERLSAFKTYIFYNQENIKNIIEDMKEGILILDEKGAIKTFNESAQKMLNKILVLEEGILFDNYVQVFLQDTLSSKYTNTNILEELKRDKQSFISEFNLDNESYQIKITPDINRFNEVVGNVVTINNVTEYRDLITQINNQNDELQEYKVELENKLNELQETQEQLIISEKMAVIGQLVAGVAHEINTPLASIKSNVDLENMLLGMIDIKDTESIDSFKENIISMNEINTMALDRIMEIVKSLKNFARLDEAEFKEADIHEGIDNTLIIVNSQIPKNIEIIKQYGNIDPIRCFPMQLNQVFLNILMNAVQAVKEKGKVIIKTEIKDQSVYIRFIDTGIGIPKENISRIFDPGFTTKGVGVGTGLGLSISYKIVSKHGGKIVVASQPGVGTEFTIILPVNLENREVTA